MNTIDELIYYCKEPEPVGALLLTGEWGCGKTYLIECDLKDELSSIAIILRISLFGMTSYEGIHTVIKQSWVEAYCSELGCKDFFEQVSKANKVISNLKFLPDEITGFFSTDVTALVTIKNKINNKKVILVFGDLERCSLDIIDVLGFINDYCENKKYHTIIVANQDKIKSKKKAMSESSDESKHELTYDEVKEKLIYRTINYIPNYDEIIQSVIDSMKYPSDEYGEFIKDNKVGILDIFALDTGDSRPHNIRSLKCAINDFYRIYEILMQNNFEDCNQWFISFTAYLLAYKAGKVDEGVYGTLFTDEKVMFLYPIFRKQYIFEATKQWIVHGIWDRTAIEHEIEEIVQRKQARKPSDIIKLSYIGDIEEDIVNNGFGEFLVELYDGLLTIDEYIRFIKNSLYARLDKFEFPKPINWDKVNCGINKCIELLQEEIPDGQLVHGIISEKDQELLLEEEKNAYLLIDDFFSHDRHIFIKNRKLYIESVRECKVDGLISVENKRFDVFDSEMAQVTAEAFQKSTNYEKHQFLHYFGEIWNSRLSSMNIKIEETKKGIQVLEGLLKEQLDILKDSNVKTTYEIIHTEKFIEKIGGLI